jgi:Fe-S cluster biogenesis protein NfuA
MVDRIFKAACDGCPRSSMTTGSSKEPVRDRLPKAGCKVDVENEKLYCPRCAQKA